MSAEPTGGEDAIWRLLHERRQSDRQRALREQPTGVRSTPDGGRSDAHIRRESLVALLDAALGVLAATRHLVEVTEGVLRDHRDRLAPSGDPPRDERADGAGREGSRKKIELSY